MAVRLAKIATGYDGDVIRCPHCNDNQYRLSLQDIGLHECGDCGEAFKIVEQSQEASEMKEQLGDIKDEIRWLKDRVEELERQLGVK